MERKGRPYPHGIMTEGSAKEVLLAPSAACQMSSEGGTQAEAATEAPCPGPAWPEEGPEVFGDLGESVTVEKVPLL